MEKLKEIFKKIIDLLEKFLTAFFGLFDNILKKSQNKDINLNESGKNLESININNDVNKVSNDNAGFNENPSNLNLTSDELEELIRNKIVEELELENVSTEQLEFINVIVKEILPIVNNINEEVKLKETIKKEVQEKLEEKLSLEINNPIVPKIITPLIVKKSETQETNVKDTFLEKKKKIFKQKEEVKEDIIVDMPFSNTIGTIPPIDLGLDINIKQSVEMDILFKQNPFKNINTENSTINNTLDNIDSSNLEVSNNNLDSKTEENLSNLDGNIPNNSSVDKAEITNNTRTSNMINNENLNNINESNTKVEIDEKKNL